MEHLAKFETEDGLVIERVFNASRDTVWRAWTEPEHFMRWYGPAGMSVSNCTLDPRVGGRRHFRMHGEHGEMWYGGTYSLVDPQSRLAYTEHLADEAGNAVPVARYGLPEAFPAESLVQLAFEDLGDGITRVILRHNLPAAMAGHAADGYNQSFDRLAEHLRTIRA